MEKKIRKDKKGQKKTGYEQNKAIWTKKRIIIIIITGGDKKNKTGQENKERQEQKQKQNEKHY